MLRRARFSGLCALTAACASGLTTGSHRVAAPVLRAGYAHAAPVLRAGYAHACTPAREEPVLGGMLAANLRLALDREERKQSSLVKEAQAAKQAESLGKWATLVTSNLYRIPAGAQQAKYVIASPHVHGPRE